MMRREQQTPRHGKTDLTRERKRLGSDVEANSKCKPTNSTTHPLAKGKSALQPTGKALALYSSHSFLSLSLEADIDQGSTGSPSIGVNPDQELEPTVPFIVLKLEEEKEEEKMALNLRIGFKERQCKRLFESLPIALPPAKRSYSEVSLEISDPDAPMVQVSLSDVARTGQELVVSSSIEKDICSK